MIGIGYVELVIISLIILILIWAIVDIVKREDLDLLRKIVWILVCLFLGIIGVGIYYFVGRKY
ncbi:MAG: PLDc N-terminal domain-containing protein [Methanosarcinales archaeon]|nr:MAG: PLDc N-terminal domain-containing protein [Methanosarcinales archaeon]